jgi:O-antigen ligase
MEYLKRMGSDDYLNELLRERRVFATIISPNIFASYIVMMLFIGIGLALYNNQRKNIIYWLGVFVMAIALLLTKSLGGILSFVITFSLFLFSLIHYKGFKKITLKRFSLIMVSTLCIIILIFGFFAKGRIAKFLDLNNPTNSIVQRFYYWKASLDMIKDFPLTGVGWRKFGLFYAFYKPAPANISHYSHNVFLQIAAEMGPLGLIIFIVIVLKFLQIGFKVIKNRDEQQGLKIGLFFAGCAFLIHNLVELSFYFSQVALFWWIILGLFSNFSSENA